MADFTIETFGVARHFGRLRAVDGIDLTVQRGEILGLLGPNGSGKTTLIRMLTGILKPTLGTVQILGVRLPNKSVMSKVGYMTQAVALYDDLSVRENVAFFASMCGALDAKKIDKAIDLVDLKKRQSTRVANLSGGMKRRASLACALVHDPEVLLLDEPTVGVDPTLRIAFWEYFRRIAEGGTTLVISSHVMDEAQRCTRLGFMMQGRIIATGDYRELMARAEAGNLEEAFLRFTAERSISQ